jgi:hypothetical protein
LRPVQPAGEAQIVIIGAGAAGLAAAREVRVGSGLLIEASRTVGGRISTASPSLGGYERGAFSAFPAGWVSRDDSQPLADERPIGLLEGGTLVLGVDPIACIERSGLCRGRMDDLRRWARDGAVPVSLPRSVASILSAFHHVIHPGPFSRYVPERRYDALHRFVWRFRRKGNLAMARALRRESRIPLRFGARVVRVDNRSDPVIVSFQTGDRLQEIRCHTAIVAVPGDQVINLVTSLTAPARRFLRRLRYGGFTAVTMLVNAPPPFSYAVSVDFRGGSFHARQALHRGQSLVTTYFADAASRAMVTWADQRIVRRASALWQKVGLRKLLGPPHVVDVARWPSAGPVISAPPYDAPVPVRAGPGVILAGDYTWDSFPYGMAAALSSGQRAARLATPQ